MVDRDLEMIEQVVAESCTIQGPETEEARRLREALARLEQRIEAADELYAALTSSYRLVWPIPGVLLTGKRRRHIVRDYEKLRPKLPEESSSDVTR